MCVNRSFYMCGTSITIIFENETEEYVRWEKLSLSFPFEGINWRINVRRPSEIWYRHHKETQLHMLNTTNFQCRRDWIWRGGGGQ
jgi:hypothetical protein